MLRRSRPQLSIRFSSLLVTLLLIIHSSTVQPLLLFANMHLASRIRSYGHHARTFRMMATVNSRSSMQKTGGSSSPVTSPTVRKTGSFISNLKQIHHPDVHFRRAMRQTRDIKLDPKIKNQRNAQRKLSAQFLDALMKGLTMPITDALNVYKKQMKRLHPFEMTVVDLTVTARMKAGHPSLEVVLECLQELRASTSKIGKDFASRAKTAATAVEAKELLSEGLATLEALYAPENELARALAELSEIQKDLRRIPMVELDVPTVVLVGAPNVGKSSLVRAVSSGTPEVNDYPFTTRGVTIGHIVDAERGLRFQVMDTPGLLDRPAEDRNEMEKLTFASMAHLPTAVLYVIDPSGLSGEKSTLQAQLGVRNHLKSRFPKRPWMDVVSKADLTLDEAVLAQLPAGHLDVSVRSGHHVNLLQEELESMLLELQSIISSRQQQEQDRK